MVSFAKKITAAALAVGMTVTAIPFAAFAAISTSGSSAATKDGFVYADGTKFMLDGSPYYYAGTNCYYLTFKSKESVDNVFNDAEAMGLKVIRVWGNMDVGVKTDQVSNGKPVFTNNNDGPGEKDGIYFQYFDKNLGKPVVNEGADGLQKLDYAIYQAEQHDMKLLITFTNYWDAFGGMGQYIDWAEQIGITGLQKEDFYTNETIKQWYKDYVNTLLNHENVYTGRKLKDEPGVFAWELANEPRCSSDAQCEDNILYNWAKEMSEYVKSVDPYHMVSLGDEGFFNKPYGYYDDYTTSNYPFYGCEGVDFEKLMTIDTLDFGTPHLYLDQWGLKHTGSGQDDLLWFKIHGETCAELDKPVILEEFGLTDKTIRDSEYSQWFEVLEGDVYDNVEYAGTNYWMIASYIDGVLYPDYDQYTVYGPEGEVTESTRLLIMEHAENMQKKNIVNSLDVTKTSFDRSSGGDISVNAILKMGTLSGVSLDGNALTNGTEYTISGNKITLKADYLKTLELKNYVFTVNCTEGNSPKLTVSVSDSSIPDPVLTPEFATVDKNSRKISDLSIAFDKKTSEFKGISVNGTKLTEGVDYTVSGDTAIISKSYISSLAEGTTTLVFDFYEGKDCEFALTVTDTSTIENIDTFESYTSDDELYDVYKRNANGNELSLSLADKNGGKALAFGYNVGSSAGYCGIDNAFKSRDVSSYKGISLWVEGDNSGNTLTVQFKDGNDNYFEYQITLDFTSGRIFEIPFDDFVPPSWQSSGNTPDTTKIEQFSLYAGGGEKVESGTCYVDDIYFYSAEEKTGAYLVDTSGTYDADAPAGILTRLVLAGQSITSIVCGDYTLDSSKDYSWNGSQVALNTSYLETLLNGKYCLVYNFSDGTSDTFALTVKGKDEPTQHEHSYTSATTKEATCTESGTITYICACGDSYTKTISAKGHSYELISSTAADCTSEGTNTYRCSVCGDTYTETSSVTGHNYQLVSSTAADCTNEGSETYKCSRCGNTYTNTISALGHSYTETVVEATEDSQGYTLHTCERCGYNYKDNFTDYNKPAEQKETVLFSGSASCWNWGQALSLDCVKNGGKVDPSDFTQGGYLYAEFTGTADEIEIIMQSWSGGANWQRISPDETGTTDSGTQYAKWSYDTITSQYGAPLSTLDKLHLAVRNGWLNVTKFSYVSGGNGNTGDTGDTGDTDDTKNGYIQYYYGNAWCGAWGQALGYNTAKNGGEIDVNDIKEGGYFYIEYTGDYQKAELIFQSWSGGAGWLRMSPTESGYGTDGYYAKWSYDSIVSAYGSDLSTIDKIYIGASDGSINVIKLQYAGI